MGVPDGYLNEEAAGELCGLSPRTLERFRFEDQGPPARRFRGRVVYRESELRAWVEAEAEDWQEARRRRLAAAQ